MTRYALTMYQPDEGRPPDDVLATVMTDLATLREDMEAAGVWVFAGPFHPPGSATVVRATGDGVLVTDGPYLEGHEHVGGFTVIDVPDLDEALRWARRTAEAVIGLPVEVRPLVG